MWTIKAGEWENKPELYSADAAKAVPQKAAALEGKQQAAKESEEEKQGVTLEISEDLKKMYQEQLESAKEAAKKAGEGMRDMAKILEIARRISNGDKVPASDEKKLMEFDSDLYQTAKAAAMLHANEKHKKQDALFEEEKTEYDEKLRALKREDASRSETAAASEAAPAEEAVAVEET